MRTTILGVGKVGRYLIQVLHKEGHKITAIDIDSDVIHEIKQKYSRVKTIIGHGGSARILKEAHVKDADFFIAVTHSDEVNMISALTAKELQCSRTIVRINNEVYLKDRKEVYQRLLGIDLVISPDIATAVEISKLIEHPGAATMETFAHGMVAMQKLRVSPSCIYINQPLKKLDIPEFMLIAGITRNNKFIIPHGETSIKPGDFVTVISERWVLPDVEELFTGSIPPATDKIAIYGLSDITLTLSQIVKPDISHILLFEDNSVKCERYRKEYPSFRIKQSNADSILDLQQLGIKKYSAFIAAIDGPDEKNILAGMLALEIGIPNVIVVIKNPEYKKILHKVGIAKIISPNEIISNAILAFIREEEIISLAVLEGGVAEMLETIPNKKSKIVGVPLRDLHLPKESLICAIVRENKVIIPHGNDVIHAGDRVIVTTLSSALKKVRKFLAEQKYFAEDEGWIISEKYKT